MFAGVDVAAERFGDFFHRVLLEVAQHEGAAFGGAEGFQRAAQALPELVAGGVLEGVFAEGAKRAGRNLTRDSLMAAFDSFKGFETGILPPITIGPDHETQKQGFWVRVENGRFKPLTDWLKSE